MLLNCFWLAKNLLKMKIFGLANFQTFFKKTCTNNPTSEIQIAPNETPSTIYNQVNKQ